MRSRNTCSATRPTRSPLVLTKSKVSRFSEGTKWSYFKQVKGELWGCVGLGLPNLRKATEEKMRTGDVRHEMTRALSAGRA